MANLGVYIQVPFCQTKCTYCNFHTGVVSSDRFAPYTQAVCQRNPQSSRNFFALLACIGPTALIGRRCRKNGCPTTPWTRSTSAAVRPVFFNPELLAGMIHALRDTFDCDLKEVTLEADPETIELEKAVHWLAAGIDRISFGTQSFID